MRNNRLGLLGALIGGLGVGDLMGIGSSKPRHKDIIRSSVPKEEQDRRIAAAQAKRERKNAARLKQAGGSHA